jgi:GalNAc5-diNAcBac-PP-undecaprenol beta-1,3-glucosyltransferase
VTVRATVVVPTFDHGPTLLRSIPTALSQTVQDIEVFVVGDGVHEETRAIMADLKERDERIRFFDHPKGPGNGEVYRHAALAEARGDVVCYLADDDLWMPEHIEVLTGLLQDADFAHTYPIRVEPDGRIGHWNVNLELSSFRQRMLAGKNFVPLDCAGHTLELYRRLPHGWRTSPEGIWSDLYMWQQILSVPGVRVRTGTRPTVIHLPSSRRRAWTMKERLVELDVWVERMNQPCWREDVYREVIDISARSEAKLQDETRGRDGIIERLQAQAQEARGELEATEVRLDRSRAVLASVLTSRTWRLRNALLRSPLLGPALRWAGRALSRQGGR